MKELHVTEMTYGQTKNRGNFENSRLEATIELVSGDNIELKLKELKKFVSDSLENETDHTHKR